MYLLKQETEVERVVRIIDPSSSSRESCKITDFCRHGLDLREGPISAPAPLSGSLDGVREIRWGKSKLHVKEPKESACLRKCRECRRPQFSFLLFFCYIWLLFSLLFNSPWGQTHNLGTGNWTSLRGKEELSKKRPTEKPPLPGSVSSTVLYERHSTF